jgi:predicted DNA-binding protein (MmcQ/YjbR family)
MNRDDVLGLCANLPGTAEDYPFGGDDAVFKVGGRMFALITLGGSP